MSSFIGTKEKFKRYIGPMLRNLVQQMTKNYKLEIGKCQHCGTTEFLESAHIHGRGRGTIIDSILNNYTTDGSITINLVEFENQFRDAHREIDKTIIILCRECHSKYDAESPQNEVVKISPQTTGKRVITPEPERPATLPTNRLFSNKEIQQRIAKVTRKLPNEELERLCNYNYSKEQFDLNFPVLIKVPANSSPSLKKQAVKDESGYNRWTWKFGFQTNGFSFAITTQWYPRNDIHVKTWLDKYEKRLEELEMMS